MRVCCDGRSTSSNDQRAEGERDMPYIACTEMDVAYQQDGSVHALTQNLFFASKSRTAYCWKLPQVAASSFKERQPAALQFSLRSIAI